MMTAKPGWRVLRDGDHRDVVVAVDFAAPGRAEAGFSDLAALLQTDLPLWETVQPEAGDVADVASRSDFWLDGLRSEGRSVRAVLGFCLGAVYGARLVDQLSSIQERPQLIVFDPEPALASSMLAEFDSVLRRLDSMLGADDVADLKQRAAAATDGTADLWKAGSALVDILDPAVATAFERAGIDAEFGEEIVDMFASLMRYSAEADSGQTPTWSGGLELRSSPERPWSGKAQRTEVFDVDHADLLRSPLVARHLDGVLDSLVGGRLDSGLDGR